MVSVFEAFQATRREALQQAIDEGTADIEAGERLLASH